MNDLIKQAKDCKSADELLALARENGIDMTAEEAAEKYAALQNQGELSDDELDGASGGGCFDFLRRAPKHLIVKRDTPACTKWICSCCGGSPMTAVGGSQCQCGAQPYCGACQYFDALEDGKFYCSHPSNLPTA